MDIRRLEVFCKVVECKGFTRAAEMVFLSQPTVSEHIRTLEEMLNVKLVDRLGREIMPTQAGMILYRYARKIIKLRDEAQEAIQKYTGKLAGKLAIGASSIPGTYILPQILGAFKQQYNDVNLIIRISNSRQIAELVRDGELEAGIVGAMWNDPLLEWEEIFQDDLILAVPAGHRLAGKKEVSFAALKKEPFILREVNSGTRKVMQDRLVDKGYAPEELNVVAEVGSTEAVRQSILAGTGISILSRRAVRQDFEQGVLAAVSLKSVSFQRNFFLIQRKKRQLSPIGTVFIDYLNQIRTAYNGDNQAGR